MSEYTLLTGASGLVGCYLTRDLLRRGHRLAVLVRSRPDQAAIDRVDAALNMWESQLERSLPRPICLEGDVTRSRLGLNSEDRRWIARNCGRLIHNAAILKFVGDPPRDPWRTNLEGTRKTLELCRETRLRDFHYVSTAYVCGKRQGVVKEDELVAGQEFRNDYERSKYEAELLVRNADFIDPPTIYRPVVIAGDSISGHTASYHGIYLYLRLLSLLLRNTVPNAMGRRPAPLRIALQGDERRNVVPVDWVSSVICQLLENRDAQGETFHLAPRVQLTARTLFDAAYRYFNAYGGKFCGPDYVFDSKTTVFEKAFLVYRKSYEEYEQTDPEFDTTNLERFVRHLPCPEIDIATIQRYLRFGEQDRWGKRDFPFLPARFRADDLIAIAGKRFARPTIESPHDQRGAIALLGLNVTGPGGGQWTLTFRGRTFASVQPGLPIDGSPVVEMDIERMAHMLGVDRSSDANVRGQTVSADDYFSLSHRRCERLAKLLGWYASQNASDTTPSRLRLAG